MSTPSLPSWEKAYRNPKVKSSVAAAKAERARLKACHGNWQPCSSVDHEIPESIAAPLSFLWEK